MRISEPNELVDEFKKSGEFDRIRSELLTQFQNGSSLQSLLAQIEETVKQQLESEQGLQSMSEALTTRELALEVERSTIVERALSDVTTLNESGFTSNLRKEISDLLLENRHPGTSTIATTRGSALRYLDKTSNHKDVEMNDIPSTSEHATAESSQLSKDVKDTEQDVQSSTPLVPEVKIVQLEEDNSNASHQNPEVQLADPVSSMSTNRQPSPLPTESPSIPKIVEPEEDMKAEEEPMEITDD